MPSKITSPDIDCALKRSPRRRQPIYINELPAEFVRALELPYFSSEQAALDYLLDEEG